MEATTTDPSTIEKIRVLNSLLNTSIPIEPIEGLSQLSQFRETTLYMPAFDEKERSVFKKKIMELVKQL